MYILKQNSCWSCWLLKKHWNVAFNISVPKHVDILILHSAHRMFPRTMRRCCSTQLCHCLYKSHWLSINPRCSYGILHPGDFDPTKTVLYCIIRICSTKARTQQTLERLRCPKASSFSSSQPATKNGGNPKWWKELRCRENGKFHLCKSMGKLITHLKWTHHGFHMNKNHIFLKTPLGWVMSCL